jgi:RNA polymerase sigma-70 factor (ECF subfamily)
VSDAKKSQIKVTSREQAAPSASSSEGLTDEQLLVGYRNGDREAFAKLVERYRSDLMYFLIRFLGSRAAAEDVFQDTFLQIHLSMDSFDEQRRFKPWLFTIAANKARDHHRRRKRREAVSLSTPIGKSEGREAQIVDLLECETSEPDTNLLMEEREVLVKQVVDSMPAHYREILLLSYFQRMSYNQISDALNIPLGTVKSRLHASVANFADAWNAARGTTMDDGIEGPEGPGDS